MQTQVYSSQWLYTINSYRIVSHKPMPLASDYYIMTNGPSKFKFILDFDDRQTEGLCYRS